MPSPLMRREGEEQQDIPGRVNLGTRPFGLRPLSFKRAPLSRLGRIECIEHGLRGACLRRDRCRETMRLGFVSVGGTLTAAVT